MIKLSLNLALALFAAAALTFLAAGNADAAKAGGGGSSGHAPPMGGGSPPIGHPAPTPNWWGHGGYGYGRGWCYWHPYACYSR
jgi:hypothetical protein